MEQLNKIEIRGNVGNVNILKVGNTRVAHFSVATNFAYKDRNGEPVIETTWHYVTAWEGNKGIPPLDTIAKGFPIYVCGRLRTQKYISGDGSEKTSYDIIANTIEAVDAGVSPQMS
ncbi:MAG: single-stranded DNA-binding protein [Bacteroidales bacterium]|nr:single-stranded DNA-binding protein [Bacteroidales bacterium]